MTLEYISLKLAQTQSVRPEQIESELMKLGQPIRWAITEIGSGSYTVEAVIEIHAPAEDISIPGMTVHDRLIS